MSGIDHDRLFGGAGDDVLDVKKTPSNPKLWTLAAPAVDTDGTKSTVNGADLVYGGTGHDAMMADHGGDRLIDWNRNYNAYRVCGGSYGLGKTMDNGDTSTNGFLSNLAMAIGSVGSDELALTALSSEAMPGYPGGGVPLQCES